MTYIPVVDTTQQDLQELMLNELKKANLHLASMSGEEIEEEDTDEH